MVRVKNVQNSSLIPFFFGSSKPKKLSNQIIFAKKKKIKTRRKSLYQLKIVHSNFFKVPKTFNLNFRIVSIWKFAVMNVFGTNCFYTDAPDTAFTFSAECINASW